MKSFSEFVHDLLSEEVLNERKIVIRFRNGTRKRKLVCGKGMRAIGSRCVRQSGVERMHRRLGNLKRKRSLNKKGSGWKKRANFKRQRSLRKRKASLGHR